MTDKTPLSLLLSSCLANSFGKVTACFTLEKRGLGVDGCGLMVSLSVVGFSDSKSSSSSSSIGVVMVLVMLPTG